jgi:hypothetical protein
MFGTLFDKVTGLFDKRFTLALLLPTFAFVAGIGALIATITGWHATLTWWADLGGARQVALGVAAAAGIVTLAIIVGTQVVAMTRLLEGYWTWPWINSTLGGLGRWRERKRRGKLDEEKDESDLGFLRRYLAFPDSEVEPEVLPTRLGNALRAAESYPGDPERWGLNAPFWWPRLYLIMPDSARDQVDGARSALDQLVVLTILAAVFCLVSLGLAIVGQFCSAGLPAIVGFPCAAGAFLLSRGSYLSAVTAATAYGDLVRSCFDLFRGDLLTRLGWAVPPALADERELWVALGDQLYGRGTSNVGEARLKAPRQPPAPPGAKP